MQNSKKLKQFMNRYNKDKNTYKSWREKPLRCQWTHKIRLDQSQMKETIAEYPIIRRDSE